MELYKVFILALVSEAVWETLKMTWNHGKVSVNKIGAILVGIFMAIGTKVDIMYLSGIPMVIPYAGRVLTGILISRGANFIHDIAGNINGIYNERKIRVNRQGKNT